MEVKVIGCSTTWSDRPMSSYCIDGSILVDCGEGTPKSYKKNGIYFLDIDHIFITHYHSDHVAGICMFLAQEIGYAKPETMKRLTVYGPKGLLNCLNALKDYVVIGGEFARSVNLTDYINVVEIDNLDKIINAGKYKVKPFEVHHIEGALCLAYVFYDNDVRVGFSGDCTYDDKLLEFIQNVDSAFLECCNFKTSKAHLGLDKYLEIQNSNPQKNFIAIHTVDKIFLNEKAYPIKFAHDTDIYNF